MEHFPKGPYEYLGFYRNPKHFDAKMSLLRGCLPIFCALAESTRARTRDFCRDDVNDVNDEREREHLRLAFFFSSSSILEYFSRKACPTGHRAYREGRTSFGVWEFGVV